MRIVPIPCLSDNYAYLLIPDGEKAALVVDPSEGSPVLAALERERLGLSGILCTHHHPDHVGGNEELLARFPGIPVYGHISDGEKGRIPGQTARLGHGESLAPLGLRAQALHIPGHTLGAVAYHFLDERAVFTGDTLFLAGCGRLFEGTPAMMYASLQRLAALPGETRVYCGHEYTVRNLEFAAAVEPDNAAIRARIERASADRGAGRPTVPATLEEEFATNPFLRTGEPAVRQAARRREPDLAATAPPEEVLRVIRRWKDHF